MKDLKISSTLEDYLEFIYKTIEAKEKVKAVEIANEFSISRATVTEALQRLEKKGYIKYGHYQPIELTQNGITLAKEIILKHETLLKFFEQILKLPTEEAKINACRIEHIITPLAFEKIKQFIEQQL